MQRNIRSLKVVRLKNLLFGVLCLALLICSYAHANETTYRLPNGEMVTLMYNPQSDSLPTIMWEGKRAYVSKSVVEGGVDENIPVKDRVLILDLVFQDGKTKQVKDFADKFINGGDVKCPPHDGSIPTLEKFTDGSSHARSKAGKKNASRSTVKTGTTKCVSFWGRRKFKNDELIEWQGKLLSKIAGGYRVECKVNGMKKILLVEDSQIIKEWDCN